MEALLYFLSRCFELDTAGWLMLIAIGGAGYTIISQMIGDHGSALLGAPILVLCSAIGNIAMADLGVASASDKVMNMAVGMTAGMLVGTFIVVFILWGWNAAMAR